MKEKKLKPKKMKCTDCNKRFVYDPYDIFSVWGIGYVVKCPNCGKNVEIKRF